MGFSKVFTIGTLLVLLFLFYALNIVGIVFSAKTLPSSLSILSLIIFCLNMILPCLSLVLYKWKRYVIVLPQIVLLITASFSLKDTFEGYYLVILSSIILTFQLLALTLVELSTRTKTFLEDDEVNFAQDNY